MDRRAPVSSKLLNLLWTAQTQHKNMIKLRRIKSTMNIKDMKPRNYTHLKLRKKKAQLEDRKYFI